MLLTHTDLLVDPREEEGEDVKGAYGRAKGGNDFDQIVEELRGWRVSRGTHQALVLHWEYKRIFSKTSNFIKD